MQIGKLYNLQSILKSLVFTNALDLIQLYIKDCLPCYYRTFRSWIFIHLPFHFHARFTRLALSLEPAQTDTQSKHVHFHVGRWSNITGQVREVGNWYFTKH